jgi:transposase
MLHVGLDLSRTRLDVHVMDERGETVLQAVAPVDAEGLAGFAAQLDARFGESVRAVVESMTGARHVYDVLSGHGWTVQVADAAKAKAFAPVACKTDKTDARVLAVYSWRDLVPAIWLPPMPIRQARELGRFRAHLVKQRTMSKNRIHSILMNFGMPVTESDLFGKTGREKLARLVESGVPQPWAGHVAEMVARIDALDAEIAGVEIPMAVWGRDRPDVAHLRTISGVGLVLGTVIAAEIGDIDRFASPAKLVGYTGLCPRVYQSGSTDRRGPLTKHGPKFLRWALIEAAVHAAQYPPFAAKYQRTVARLGSKRGDRGRRIARVELARDLATAIWYMLTNDEDFAPAPGDAARDLAA